MKESDLAAIRTPAFVLEMDAFRRNLDILDCFRRTAGVELILALKGFAMHAVFPRIREVTTGAAASSLYEGLLAAEFFPAVYTYAPVYREDEFDRLAAISGHVTFNSLTQYNRYRHRLGRARAGLRVNPGWSDVATERYNPCVAGSRLGIQPDMLDAGLPAGITGLHIHNLCESGAAALATTIDRIETRLGRLLDTLEWLNLGGGHLITRADYERPVAIAALRALRQRHPGLRIMLEPGAAFAWRAGVLTATVLDIIETEALPVANLDTSFAAHMPDCLEMPYTPAVRGAVNSGEALYRYRLGGCTCLAGDVVGDYAFEHPLVIGQKLVFEDMMHYTMVKTNTFNGVALPDIGIWDNGHYTVIARFGYDSYKSRLS